MESVTLLWQYQKMEVSINLPDKDVEFLDEYGRSEGHASRSVTVHEAVRLLRRAVLGDAYAEAWAEWLVSDDAELWAQAGSDGLGHN